MLERAVGELRKRIVVALRHEVACSAGDQLAEECKQDGLWKEAVQIDVRGKHMGATVVPLPFLTKK